MIFGDDGLPLMMILGMVYYWAYRLLKQSL
jgi:hypothetical protein